jgi:hypothetical protein
MRDAWEWKEEDVEALVRDRIQESLTLDYKESKALKAKNARAKKELSKDVSSFANSAGGTIVYGVVENGHVPTAIDGGFDPAEVTREWIEQVINSTIQRRIDGIRINQIELRKTCPGRVLYVVAIPHSERAPHMASDHRYYKRFNFEAQPMEEYEVRDISNRSKGPDLALSFEFKAQDVQTVEFQEDRVTPKPLLLQLMIWNKSPVPTEYHSSDTYIDSRLLRNAPSDTVIIRLKSTDFKCNRSYKNHAISEEMPVWQGMTFVLQKHQIYIPAPVVDEDYALGWRSSAPYMTTRHGFALLHVREGKVSVENLEVATDTHTAPGIPRR